VNFVIVGVFFILMIVIGLVSMHKIRNPASYFVADRNGSSATITGSLLATIVGGSGTIGLAGLGYSKGLVGAWWMLVGAAGMLVLSVWLAKKVRDYAVYTLPEILECQYGGSSIKVIASVVIATAWLGIIAGQIIAAGKILSVLWPGQLEALMITATSVFIVYTVLGGQYSILRTDLIQSVIIIVGLVVCVTVGVSTAGGIGSLARQLPETYFAFPVSPSFGWVDLTTFLLFVGAAYLVGPDIYSRIFCAKNSEIARKSVMTAALIMIPLAFFVTVTGMTARAILPGISPESALPALVMHAVPVGISGLIIAALLAAVMSSADTCLLTTSTIISADIILPLFRGRIGEKKLLFMSRVGVVVIGMVSLLIALKLKGIIASLLLGYTVYTGGLVVPVLMGFYAKRLKLNAYGVIAAIIGGGGMGLFCKLTGYGNLALLTLPVSAFLLFLGSYAARHVKCKTPVTLSET